MKRCFVLGGAGFIGFNLVRRLIDEPGVEHVTVFDNLSSGTRDRVVASKNVTFVEGNARDFDFLRVKTEGHDTVFHLAANPDIARAVREPTIDFEQGTILTQNVLEAMRVNKINSLFYLSGSGVYGDWLEDAIDEITPCQPVSTYGASKLASEAMISAYCRMFDLRARVLRPANIVGPRQTHGVGYDFLRKLRADPTKLIILGDGHQTKSYIHVDDVIDALLMPQMQFLAGTNAFEVYNIATQDRLSVHSIARFACDALGIDREKVQFECTGGRQGWRGDVPNVWLWCEKLHELGWKPKYYSRDAMIHSLEAMRDELLACANG